MNLVPSCDSPTVNIIWVVKYKVTSQFGVKCEHDAEFTFLQTGFAVYLLGLCNSRDLAIDSSWGGKKKKTEEKIKVEGNNVKFPLSSPALTPPIKEKHGQSWLTEVFLSFTVLVEPRPLQNPGTAQLRATQSWSLSRGFTAEEELCLQCLGVWCHTWLIPVVYDAAVFGLLEAPHSQLPEIPWMEQLVMAQEGKPQGTAWFPSKGIFPCHYSHSLICVFKICLGRILQNSFLVLDLFFQTPRGSVKTLRILVNLFISLKAGRLTGFSYA